ncbi:MAG: hypothetical protein P1U40_01600 [Coxiellaceae bacterium]|nr:hypothetical protein [Coxiellaceae bacterium]
MRKPVYFALTACASLFLRHSAIAAFKERASSIIGESDEVALAAGVCSVMGATAITYYLLFQTGADGHRDIEYRRAYLHNKWLPLHILISLPLTASVIDAETSVPLKIIGGVSRMAVDIVVAQNLCNNFRRQNTTLLMAVKDNPVVAIKLLAVLSLVVPLAMGLGNNTQSTVQALFSVSNDSIKKAVNVFGIAASLPYVSTIAHSSVDGYLNVRRADIFRSSGCLPAVGHAVKNSVAVIFSASICFFYGMIAESGVGGVTKNDKLLTAMFLSFTVATLPFIQPAVNQLLGVIAGLFRANAAQVQPVVRGAIPEGQAPVAISVAP